MYIITVMLSVLVLLSSLWYFSLAVGPQLWLLTVDWTMAVLRRGLAKGQFVDRSVSDGIMFENDVRMDLFIIHFGCQGVEWRWTRTRRVSDHWHPPLTLRWLVSAAGCVYSFILNCSEAKQRKDVGCWLLLIIRSIDWLLIYFVMVWI